MPDATLPIAVDAMGSDRGPAEIVAGARQAAETLGVGVLLVGRPDALGDTGGMEVLPAADVVDMGDDPVQAVRRKRDASIVRAAEAVREGRASAVVSAGNTGAAMAAALLRMGRISGVQRPAIATPLPIPGSTPTLLIDCGANAECTPGQLVQFAQMGAVFAAERFGIPEPRVALLSIGEEPSKGNPLVREAHARLASLETMTGSGGRFVGNVEGRHLLSSVADVVVTDGFTGNVVLKTLEGGVKFTLDAVRSAVAASPEGRQASQALFSALAPLVTQLDPDSYGGAVLLGVDGVCVISHGSSSSRAIVNAVGVARAAVADDLVGRLRQAVAGASFTSAQAST